MENRKVLGDVAAAPAQTPARRRIAQTTDLGDRAPYGGINRQDIIQKIAAASLSAGPEMAIAEYVAGELRSEQIAAIPVRLTSIRGPSYAVVYRSPESQRWNVVDKGRVYDTQATNVQTALELVHPWLWSFQELVSDETGETMRTGG
ncbi:MAG: hypothetical protein H7338_07170 [Candidatus Sericytochromatia bacterium]|nr:hypothetical protein [Candidatus Sericytochromatia bacterium]